jgi:hypothetical protein
MAGAWSRCDDLTTKVSPARGAALLQETGKTSHNPLGKANRHESAPPHGEQNLAVSE